MNTSTTAQCGSEIVGHKELMDLHAENFQLRSELTRLRNENSDLANKALSLQSELAAARKALEEIEALADNQVNAEVYTQIDAMTDLQKIRSIVLRSKYAALSSKEPEGK